MRMLRAARHANRIRAAEGRHQRLPLDRRALHGHALDVVVVEVRRQRNLARGEQLPEERVADADLRLRLREPAEERQPLLLAPVLHHRAEPVDVARLEADAPGPARMEQVVVRGGHFLRPHEHRVVADGEEVEPVGDVTAVRRKGSGGQLVEVRAVELLEKPFAIHRLHLGTARLEHVAGKPPRARFRDGALQQALAVRPPQLGADAVLLLERGRQRAGVLRVERRVDRNDPFLLRAGKNPIGAIGALP